MNEVEVLLSNYRKNKAELKLYQSKIDSLEATLQYNDTTTDETKDEAISGLSLQAPRPKHIPHSETNKFYSMTEMVAEIYKLDLQPNKFDKEMIQEQIERLKLEISKLQKNIETADALIESLNELQRYIIKKFYIQSFRLPEIVELHNQATYKFPFSKCKNTIIEIKRGALVDMQVILDKIKGPG